MRHGRALESQISFSETPGADCRLSYFQGSFGLGLHAILAAFGALAVH